MPARSTRTGRSGGRVTPKGTRPSSAPAASTRRPGDGAHHRMPNGADPNRGIRPGGYHPPAPRSGTRGNR